jgi:hypothetical protein
MPLAPKPIQKCIVGGAWAVRARDGTGDEGEEKKTGRKRDGSAA